MWYDPLSYSVNPIDIFTEIFLCCLGQKCLLFSIIKQKCLYSQKIFVVLLKTAKVKPSESFHIYGTSYLGTAVSGIGSNE